MKVLVACEESQTVCKAFREKGHEAYSCDVQECSGGHPEWHICGDALQVLGGNCFFITQDMIQHEIVGHWDIVIAHPPCTYISNAGACRLFPKKGELDYKRYSDGLNGKNFFMCFYLYGLYGVGKIAIENPVPSSVFELPPATQVIQPWQFGDPYSKKNTSVVIWASRVKAYENMQELQAVLPFRDKPKTWRRILWGGKARRRCKESGEVFPWNSKCFRGPVGVPLNG